MNTTARQSLLDQISKRAIQAQAQAQVENKLQTGYITATWYGLAVWKFPEIAKMAKAIVDETENKR